MIVRFASRLDRVVEFSIAVAQWLALPLVVLLFLQWPLRDLLRAYSREANDIGQVIFALYVAVSVTAATRAGTHLAADTLAQRYSARARHRLRQIGSIIGLVPWAFFVLIAGSSFVVPSVLGLERFPDTNNPDYFIIKAALWVMTILVIAQALIDFVRPMPSDDA